LSYRLLCAAGWCILLQILALETMLAIKFGRGLYPKPWPTAVLVSWTVAIVLCGVLLVVWQLRLWRRQWSKAGSASAQQQQQQRLQSKPEVEQTPQ
jgi:hypothetical protein